MAGEQDIISLGLNIDSFNASKQAKLKEFILLFNDLAKYDGKIFNPVMGDGLTKFNTSIAETNRLVDELNIKLNKLNSTQVNPQVAPVQQVTTFTRETEKASIAVKEHGNQVNLTNTKFGELGRQLTKNLSLLRTLAYILPGIGLAGIFNLGFDAIKDVITALTGVNDKMKVINIDNKEYIDDLKTINDLLQSTLRIQNELSSGINIEYKKQDLDYYKSLGENLGFILDKKIELSNLEKDKSIEQLRLQTGISDPNISVGAQMREVSAIGQQLQKLNEQKRILLKGVIFTKKDLDDANKAGFDKQTLELLRASGGTGGFVKKETRDNLDKLIESTQKLYDQQLSLVTNYYKSVSELRVADAAKVKYISDQARTLLVETSKDAISVEQNKNKEILSNIQSTHEERLKAIKQEKEEQEGVNSLNRIKVTGTPENPNLTFSPGTSEYKIAVNKQTDENRKAQQKYNADILKENIDFYQKQLKAKIEIQKNEVELDAINNERIEQNEHISLEDRLLAYSKYIEDKTKLEDLEYNLAIAAGKSFEGDQKSSLTQLQIDKFRSDRDSQTLKNKSDAEAKIYQIVYSSLQNELKSIIVAGETEGAYNKHKLIQDLEANNDAYNKKEISLRKYLKRRKDILEKDERDALQKEIDDDRKQQLRLFNLQQDAIKGLEDAQGKLDKAKSSGADKFTIDKAEGEVKARAQNLEDINKEVEINNKKTENDRLKKAKIGYDDDNKLRNQWVDAALEIEKALYKGIKDVGDRIYENRVANLERQKTLFDQQYDIEREAVEKSSLNAKDKIALDIQLAEQKHEYDVNAQKEERRLKVEEAEFNKKLAVANAIIGISAAIIRDGLTTPKSIADAVVGAIELAEIISTPIPSYFVGTDSLPKSGLTRFGEKGQPELIKQRGKKPFIALTETVSYLEKGTQIIPLRKDSPVFDKQKNSDESWAQTRFLAKQIKNSNKEIKNVFKPTIIIDMGFENRKKQILGN